MVSSPYSEDIALRDRILAGDPSAAEGFFERHLDRVYEFVHYRVGSVGPGGFASEDVVQETFLAALENLQNFDGRSSLYTWLCGIAKNKIRSQRRKRRPVPLQDVLADSEEDIDAILSAIEDMPLPEHVLEARETEELVGATLSSLPDEYRDALLEKYVEGSSVRAIGDAAGKSEKAAESMLHRARLAFTKVFTLLAKRRGGIE